MAKEEESLKIQSGDSHHKPHMMSLEVRNESISGKTLIEIKNFLGRKFVCSRIRHDGHVSIPDHETVFNIGDQLFIVCSEEDAPAIVVFIGKKWSSTGKNKTSQWFPVVFWLPNRKSMVKH